MRKVIYRREFDVQGNLPSHGLGRLGKVCKF